MHVAVSSLVLVLAPELVRSFFRSSSELVHNWQVHIRLVVEAVAQLVLNCSISDLVVSGVTPCLIR